MAAHDYYSGNAFTSKPYHDYDSGAPSPISRLPSNDSSHYSQSNYDTHYQEGQSYLKPLPHQPPSTSYQGNGRLYDEDLEDDGRSIPMSSRKPKHDSQVSVAPILPPQIEDPFVRDIQPGRGNKGLAGRRQDGWFKGKITWVVYVLTIVQLIVFIVELVRNGTLTGTPIEIKPQFNPMIGPSPYVLINMGARYQPCMHAMEGVQDSAIRITWPCPNATSITGADVQCTLSQLCGFGGVPNPHVGGSVDAKPTPNQWFRFIVPIFIHAGIIHISFNLLLQLTLGRDIEKLIGSVRFAIVYFASGIFGFVLGGNFAATGIASCGCSGSLFGILAITLIDLLYTWRSRRSPIKDLLFIMVDVAIAFVLGLLPGLDNFSHIGGFLMGLVLGVCIIRSPPAFRARSIAYAKPFNPANSSDSPRRPGRHDASSYEGEGLMGFVKSPLEFFKHRQGIWWLWLLVRAGALIGVLIGFIVLLKNFYVWRHGCSWCKYLSCLPVNNWCKVGNLDFTPTNNTKRAVTEMARLVFEGS